MTVSVFIRVFRGQKFGLAPVFVSGRAGKSVPVRLQIGRAYNVSRNEKPPPPHFPIFAAAALAALCPLNAPAAIETVTYGNFEISYFGLGDTDSDWLTSGLTGARDYSEDASETDPLMYKSLKNGEVRRELLA